MRDSGPPPSPEPGKEPAPDGRLSCDLCGATAVERHCKIICTRCGYIRDCSDP